MGSWKLEAFKMALYMSFPVGAFLIFNSPSFYENAIYEWRRELNALTVKDKDFEEYAKECQRKRMKRELEAIQLTTKP